MGRGIQPLYDGAAGLPDTCPGVYTLLSLVDALRAGRVRERKLAGEMLENML